MVIAASASALQLEAFRTTGGLIGTAVSSAFLLLIAAVNLAVLGGVWRGLRLARRGKLDPADLDPLLSGPGVLARLFRPLFRMVGRSWHMYPIGFLFGLGFDTATEVGLLALAGAEAASGMAFWQVLVFPALFTAGMALVDTADSVLMVRAYGWAFVHPLRKLWYNLTVTAASAAVALAIGGLEALGLLVGRLGLDGGAWAVIARLNRDLADVGFAVIGLFALAWAVSAAIYRWKGYDAMVAPAVE